MPSRGGRRYAELDALRGVAAATVVVGHFLLVIPAYADANRTLGWAPGGWKLLQNSPLHALWAGTAAVMLFFVLSGFVLALPFVDGHRPGYAAFAVRRICRIWTPFAAAVAVALLARTLITRRPDGLSWWVHGIWSTPISGHQLLTQATLVSWFDQQATDPVLWSLIHEMRVSLVFPALMLLVACCRWQLVAAAVLVVGGVGVLQPDLGVGGQLLGDTLKYLVPFVAGALLAKHRGGVFKAARATPAPVLPAVGLLLYTAPFWVAPTAGSSGAGYLRLLVVTGGCCLLIVAAVTVPWVARALATRPARFLGRASYSLYLVHAILIVAAVNLLAGTVPAVVAAGIAVVVSVPLAYLGYRFVEVPSIRGGRAAARWLTVRSASGAAAAPSTLPEAAGFPPAAAQPARTRR